MRNLLVILAGVGFIGAVGITVAAVFGHAPHLILRILACVLVMDHSALTLLYVLQPTRVQMLGLLLRATAPLVFLLGIVGIVDAAGSGLVGERATSLATATAALGAVLVALGALTIVYLAREGEERPLV